MDIKDVKLIGLTVHPTESDTDPSAIKWEPEGKEPSSSNSFGRNDNETDTKVFPQSRTDASLPNKESNPPNPPTPNTIGIQLPCGHTLEKPTEWQRSSPENVLCIVPVFKKCGRGHVSKVYCHTVMSQFKCMTDIKGPVPPLPSCPHPIPWNRKCWQVDLTLGHYICPILRSLKAKCPAGEHGLKAPCHLVCKVKGMGADERKRVPLPSCEEPFGFRCTRGEHNQSVPCHQRSRAERSPCNVMLTKTLDCGHEARFPCAQRKKVVCRQCQLPKECDRGHVTLVSCNMKMSNFKCMTVIPGVPRPPSCTHQRGCLVPRKCHEVDLTLGHHLCPDIVDIKARCAAEEHPLKAPCHLAGTLNGLNSKRMNAVFKFPPCQEPFLLECKRGLHNESLPCHQMSLWRIAYDSCPSPSPPPQPLASVESILNDVKAFAEKDERWRDEYKKYLYWYIRDLLPPPSICGIEREGQDVVVGKLLDRMEETVLTLPPLVKTSSVLIYLMSQWKYLADGEAQVAVSERMKKIVQVYHTVIETGSKVPCKEKELQGTPNFIFQQWCGCYVESATVVKSKMEKLILAADIARDNKAIDMYELILQLSDTFLQSVSENPLHNDAQFCVELKGLGRNPEMKRAVMWTLLGILVTLKDPSSALDVGKYCGDLVSELLDDLNIPISRVRGIVEDDEFYAWKAVLKSVFSRPSEMYEINNRIKNPKAKAWFRGLEVDNPTRKEFSNFYLLSPEFDDGFMKLDVLKVEKPSFPTTINNETDLTDSPPTQCSPHLVGSSPVSSGNNNKRSSGSTSSLRKRRQIYP